MKQLHSIAKTVFGNVLVIGTLDETIIEKLKNNPNIIRCDNLTSSTTSSNNKGKEGRGKKIRIRKLRKKFHKKKIDHIICHMDEVYPYLKTFVKDSVYINRGKLYFYGKKDQFDLEKVIKMYKRYHASTLLKYEGNNFFLLISNEHSNTNRSKELYFQAFDSILWLCEMIAELLTN